MKESIETGIRVKAIFIYIVVAIICCGMIVYLYHLRQNIGEQRKHIEKHYHTLALTNDLVYAVNQAQSELNFYLTSKKNGYLKAFRQKSVEVGQLIDSLEVITGDTSQLGILKEIGVLLNNKERIIVALNRQLTNQNPIESMNERLQSLDSTLLTEPLLVTSMVKDTVVNTTQKKGFWRRLSEVFSSDKTVDTIIRISTSRIDTIKLVPDEKRNIISEMSDFAEQASVDYSSRITAIERQVNHLILIDQEISAQISVLLNELSRQTIYATLEEIQKSEQLIRKNYTFSIIGGSISLVLILAFILLIINDVNKSQTMRKELELANTQTKQIMESRHQLLLSVSHDIKTPLNSILGYLDLWTDNSAIPQKQLSSMQNSGKHILALLENLLEFSSLEQGTLVIANSRFNLWELCVETSAMFEPLALQKGLSFESDFAMDKNMEIYSDALKIKQIIINILSNAIKYTLEGSISFKVTYERDQVYFYIHDTGAGIPENQMDVLYKPFSRVDRNNALAPGSGLGMYVVKGLIELLHGEISISSIVDEGTQVEVMIPTATVIEKLSTTTSKHILLIDDDTALLVMLKDMLLKLGHTVEICHHPENFDPQKDTEGCDLVITDMEMGVISGIDILTKIRGTGKKITVIIMTGRSEMNEEIAFDAGFDGYLLKPVTMEMLRRLTSGGSVRQPVGKFESLEEMFEGDKQAIAEVLKAFVRSTAENIHMLRQAIAGNDFQKAQAICHKMLPMFMQIEASDGIEFLKQMDAARSEGAEQHPFWKGKISDFIVKAEKLIISIRKEYPAMP